MVAKPECLRRVIAPACCDEGNITCPSILDARVMVRVAKASPARLASITVLSNAIQQSYQFSGGFDVRISFSMLWVTI
jgi:hypothetical protein